MLRWLTVTAVTLFDMTIKMYRPIFEADKTISIQNLNFELDHYAYKFLGSELDMYKILDINFIEYFEERGDVTRLTKILIPVTEKTNG